MSKYHWHVTVKVHWKDGCVSNDFGSVYTTNRYPSDQELLDQWKKCQGSPGYTNAECCYSCELIKREFQS